jgi:hypothetical protein
VRCRMVFYSAIRSPNVLNVRGQASTDSTSTRASGDTPDSPAPEVLFQPQAPWGHFSGVEHQQQLDSRRTSDTAETLHSTDFDPELAVRLPAVVVEKFLELHKYVAAREKHRRLREALLITAAELEKSSGSRKVSAEIQRARQTKAVGVRGQAPEHLYTAMGDRLPLPQKIDRFGADDLANGNDDSALRTHQRGSCTLPADSDDTIQATLSGPDDMDMAIVQKMLGEEQVYARTHTCVCTHQCARTYTHMVTVSTSNVHAPVCVGTCTRGIPRLMHA